MTFWVAGAVVASSAIGAYSANKAAGQQVDASNAANAEQGRQYDQTRADQLAQYQQQRADQAPYRDAALPSIANLSKGLQPGGQYAKTFTLADYQADPGYQFRLQQGDQGIQRAAAARGGAYSGATLKALARFNSDQASQEYGAAYSRFNTDQTTQFNRNAALAGIGQTANTAVGNAGTNAYNSIANADANASNSIAQNMIGAGNARASGYVGGANAIGNGISQYMNYTQNQNLLSTLNRNQFTPNINGSGTNPYQGYDAAANGGWGGE